MPGWYVNTDLDRPRRIRNVGSHDCAVLCEGIGECWREFETFEVVAIRDHLALLRGRDLEHEVTWEPIAIPVTVNRN